MDLSNRSTNDMNGTNSAEMEHFLQQMMSEIAVSCGFRCSYRQSHANKMKNSTGFWRQRSCDVQGVRGRVCKERICLGCLVASVDITIISRDHDIVESPHSTKQRTRSVTTLPS